jgi:GGDEF domain-containing protein
MQQEVTIAGRRVSTSISVGIARHAGAIVRPADAERRVATHREATAALLLRHADTAMYAAKGAGKSRAVLAEAKAG